MPLKIEMSPELVPLDRKMLWQDMGRQKEKEFYFPASLFWEQGKIWKLKLCLNPTVCSYLNV